MKIGLMLLSGVLAALPQRCAANEPAVSGLSEKVDELFYAEEVKGREESRHEVGRYLIVTYRSPLEMASTMIVASEPAKREEIENILAAAFPEKCGKESFALDCPKVQTLDQYLWDLKKGEESERARWSKKHPGEKDPLGSVDEKRLRAELEAQLKGRDAVFLHYVASKADTVEPK